MIALNAGQELRNQLTNQLTNQSLMSLCIRLALILQSLELTKESEPSRVGHPVTKWLIPLRPFVSQAVPVSEALSLSATPRAASALTSGSNHSRGCSLLAPDSMCTCYALDSGLLLDCRITAFYQLKDVLKLMKAQPIKSFSVYSTNQSMDSLPEKLFQNFSTIEQIYISLASLMNVSVESLEGLETSLKTFSLVNSRLKAIPKTALSVLKKLTVLDLGSNQMQELEAYAFYGLPLVSLNLQSNQINSLQEFSLRGLENSLVELILVDNKVEHFPLPALRRLKALEILKLQSNRISELPDDESVRFPSLKILDLHSNSISRLDSRSFQTTPRLVSLSVANNRLTALSDASIFRHLLDLETLDLSFNELTVVSLNDIKALRTIDLSNNQLEDITLRNLLALKELFLSHNNIPEVTNRTFVNSTSLSVIFLQHNAIEWIDANAFHSLQYLLTLDLSFNQLKALDSALIRYNTKLQSLYLDNNPFDCNCKMLSIYEWLESHSRLLALDDRQDMICSSPPKLKDSSFVSLSVTDFCPIPIISVMKISKLESTQVRIKWEVQNDTLVDGFTLEHYQSHNKTPPMALKLLGPSERSLDITDLKPENWYMFCVQANGKFDFSRHDTTNDSHYFTANRKCSQVRTLSKSGVISVPTLVIVVSAVVLCVLMITLCVLLIVYKSRAKRRRPLKSQVPEEFITYRHFSLPSSETVY